MYAPHWWFPFPFILLTFLVVFLLVRLLFFRRWGWGCGGGWNRSFDAESILKRRLASGQITEDEFKRLRDIVKA